jgi:hypothetical protein
MLKMKYRIKIFITGLLLLSFIPQMNGQKGMSDERLRQARLLLSDYRDAAHFSDMYNGGYDPASEDMFRNCFSIDRIVFDVPIRRIEMNLRNRQNLQQPDLTQDEQIISIYLQPVTIDEYIETLRSAFDLYQISDFTFNFTEVAWDTTGVSMHNKMLVEVRKSFGNTSWSVSDAINYIFEIRFIDQQPKIAAVRQVDKNIAMTNVSLTFVNSNLQQDDPGYQLSDAVSHIKIEFDERISNRRLIAGTDSVGKIDLGQIPNRALLKVDTVSGLRDQKFAVPADWRLTGIKVSSQPSAGFVVPLSPWKWNGFSWSVRSFAGLVRQSENRLVNFSSVSGFDNELGYKFGFGVEMAKHISLEQISTVFGKWLRTDDPEKMSSRRNTYLGLGAGFSYYQYQYRISAAGFNQNPYNYLDRLDAPVQVVVSGTGYSETISGNGLMLPLFVEFRKNIFTNFSRLKAFSFQTGMNFMIPFETDFDISGSFSRHGVYNQFNPKPITDDPFYNYYTDETKSLESKLTENAVSSSWMFRLSGYIDVSGSRSDNLLDIGLLLMLPFSNSAFTEPEGFYIASENDNFNSVSMSKGKIYDLFIGLSIGYNFINYRVY